MKRLRKNLSVFCILALMLSFFGGNLIVHAEPDGGHSDTDSTPVITDVVDGENAKVFTCTYSEYDFGEGKPNNLGYTLIDKIKLISKAKDGTFKVVKYDRGTAIIEQSSNTELSKVLDDAETLVKNTSLSGLKFDADDTLLVFDSNNKCICNVKASNFETVMELNWIKGTGVTVTASEWVSSESGYICTLTIDYGLDTFNSVKDKVVSITVAGEAIDISDDTLSEGSGSYSFNISDENEGDIDYGIRTEFNNFYSGTVTLPIQPENDNNPDTKVVEPVISFSKIPESIAYGETFKLTVSSDQPVILQFDSALLNKSEKDYIKEAEVEISRNGVYSYVAKNQDGVVVTGTLEINCFEDDVTDNDTDDSYWNGVDDSSKKLAQTGLYNNPIFYIISFMLVAGIALIVYVLKFRKRGANNE